MWQKWRSEGIRFKYNLVRKWVCNKIFSTVCNSVKNTLVLTNENFSTYFVKRKKKSTENNRETDRKRVRKSRAEIMVMVLMYRMVLLNRPPTRNINLRLVRLKTHSRIGTVLPMPKTLPFGLIGVLCSVIPGLFIGATISKNIANFLEENDLFVPSDDDDDED